ncbi:MAG: tetratricopeptide repeat protein [Pseudomonadota bacterium]|nr:tetratricopeptide repeat protein [Pseudomonadota bacterium]
MIGLTMVGGETASAIERNRKNLLKLQLRGDKKRAKSRVVMRLNQGGYYETEEDHENRKLLIKLFEFHNFGAQPIKVLDDPLVKGVNVSEKEQYLEIAIYLKINNYSFKVSLFESPAICVVDIKATEPVKKALPSPKKPVAALSSVSTKSEVKKKPASKVTTEPEPEVKASPSKPRSELPTSTKPVEPESLSLVTDAVVEPPGAVSVDKSGSEPVAPPIETVALPVEPVADQEKKSPSLLPIESSVLEVESEIEPKAEVEAEAKAKAKAEVEVEVEAEAVETKIDPAPGQELFDQALKAYQEEDYVAAEELFGQLIDAFPDSPLNIPSRFRSFDARAQVAIIDGGMRDRMAVVIDEFLVAVRTHEDHFEAPWALLQVARLYEKMEFFYEAAGIYKALLIRYPKSPFAAAANFALARLNFSLQRYDDAYADFSSLLERQPEGGFSVYAHYYRANALTYLGKARQALTEYRVGIEKDPDFLQRDPLSLYLMGSAYHRLQRYIEAKEYFLMMRNLFPDNENTPQALAKIGEILVLEKKLPEAMRMFTTVVKEFPGSEGDIVSRLKMAILGEDLKTRQKLEPINEDYALFLDSVAAYRYLIEHHSESPFTDIARLELGQLYLRQGQYRNARQVLGRMLIRRLKPGLRDAAFTSLKEAIFAEIEELYNAGNYESIVTLQHEYRDDFLSRPGSVYPFLWVGEALHKEGFEKGALQVYQEVEKFKPKSKQQLIINWGIGDLLLGLERFEEAEIFLAKLELKDMPADWRLRMLLLKIRLLKSRGLVREALELLDKVKVEVAELAIKERVDMAVLEADMLLLVDEDQGQVVTALHRAVTLAFMYPQKIEVSQRLLLGYRLARMLYKEKKYDTAEAWFAKVALLAPSSELAELLYWQLRCQIGLVQEGQVGQILLRLQEDYPANPWTTLAQTAVQDFRWQQENRSLK